MSSCTSSDLVPLACNPMVALVSDHATTQVSSLMPPDQHLSTEYDQMGIAHAGTTCSVRPCQRTKEALARRKAEGKQLGRPKGSFGVSKLDQHEDEIRKLLSHGVAEAAIARMYGSSCLSGKSGIGIRKC
jgi:hypothetical protein